MSLKESSRFGGGPTYSERSLWLREVVLKDHSVQCLDVGHPVPLGRVEVFACAREPGEHGRTQNCPYSKHVEHPTALFTTRSLRVMNDLHIC